MTVTMRYDGLTQRMSLRVEESGWETEQPMLGLTPLTHFCVTLCGVGDTARVEMA